MLENILTASQTPAATASLIIGILGAIIIAIYVMPQAVKVIRTHETQGLSLIMFILSATGSFFYFLSAICNIVDAPKMPSSWAPMLIGNFFSCASSIVVIVFKVINMRWAKKFGVSEADIGKGFKQYKSLIKAEKDAIKGSRKPTDGSTNNTSSI